MAERISLLATIMSDFIIIRAVSKKEMRKIFNSSGLQDRRKSGELKEWIEKERHANPDRSGQPFCTYSQLLQWLDGVTEVVKLHRYLLPDLSIGGSGLEDPVRLELGSIVYKLKRKD